VSFGKLMIDDFVTVIGRYRQDDANNMENTGVDEKFAFDAIVIEIGGNADQVKGIVASTPDENGRFDFVVDKDVVVTVQIQEGTKIIGTDGELDRSALVIAQKAEIEGVVVKAAVTGDPDTIRAALILIDDGYYEDKLSGTIATPLDSSNMSFMLSTASGDLCVDLNSDSTITLISETADGTQVKIGTFADLASGQSVAAYGQQGATGCFDASDVVVDLTGQP